MARTANNQYTRQAYEEKGRGYGRTMIANAPDVKLEGWQKVYREYGNACELSGMTNWRIAAKVRGTREVIRQHIEKLMAAPTIPGTDIPMTNAFGPDDRFDVYVYIPQIDKWACELKNATANQADVMVANLTERKWQTDVRLVGV